MGGYISILEQFGFGIKRALEAGLPLKKKKRASRTIQTTRMQV
jgi:hypothetical protein